MLFIHPMWVCESQRLGKKKCTPTGYAIHSIADLLGLVGLLLLLAVLGFWVWKAINQAFSTSQLWLIAVPILVGIVSELLFHYSWQLALRKDFKYDYKAQEASWIEAGERCSYKYRPSESERS